MRRFSFHPRSVNEHFPGAGLFPTVCFLLICLCPPQIIATPANDNFASRIVLDGDYEILRASLLDSTRESDEPMPSGFTSFGSVWWQWTSPADGIIEIKDLGDPTYRFAEIVAVYQGDSLDSLVEVASEPSFWYRPLHFKAVAGQTYQIAISDRLDPPREAFCELVRYDVPPNDNFSDRLPLQLDVTNVACNIFSSVEPGEPGESSAHHTLWWTWTAPSHGVVNALNEEHTLVQLYVGASVDSLVRQEQGYLLGMSGYEVQEDEILQIRVDEHPFSGEPAMGHVEFSLRFSPVPRNDQFVGRMVLSGLPAETTGDNTMATAENGEPRHMKQTPSHTLWYQWTAPTNGRVGILLEGSWVTKLVSVYTGDSLSGLRPIAGASYSPAHITFVARAGRTYVIAIGTTYSFGPFKLAIVGAPPNDRFSSPLILRGLHSESASYTLCATPEPHEPHLAPFDSRQSVWWDWQAPMSGLAVLTARAEYPVPLQVFTGDALSQLQPIALQDASVDSAVTTTSFLAASNTVYRISASGIHVVEDHKLLTKNGRIALGLTMATLRLLLKDPIPELVAPQTITFQAQPLLSQFGFPTNLAFTAARDGWLSVGGSTVGPPWEFTFTNLPAGVHTLSATGTNEAGEWQFSAPIAVRVRPPHDDFTKRAILRQIPAVISGSLAGSTIESGEPKLFSTESGSVWYTWTAPGDIKLHITVYTGSLGIYEGDSLDHLRMLRKFGEGSYFLNAASNHTYQFKASSPSDPEHAEYFVFFAQPRPNDDFAHRLILTGTNVNFIADASDATVEPFEPSPARPSLWWSWTAPGDGYLSLSRTNIQSSTELVLYQGASLKTLQAVPIDNPGNPFMLRFRVASSVNYQIAARVWTSLAASPDAVSLHFVPAGVN